MARETEFLTRPDGARLAYQRIAGRVPGPGLIFLGGFNSDMSGVKATGLAEWAAARGRAVLCFDYRGHGQSSGAFRDGTIGSWRDDALAVLDALTQGPQILIGSSMGGWLMLLTALARPERIAGLVGIAAAPDFTEDLMWDGMDSATRARLAAEGEVAVRSDYGEEPYIITRALIEEARQHLVLRGPIAIDRPVRLLHGMCDADVPYQTSISLAEKLTSADVTVTLIKDGDHRLSREEDLQRIFAAVEALSERATRIGN